MKKTPQHEKSQAKPMEEDNNDVVAQLIRGAGPEESIDPAIQQRVYSQLQVEWRQSLRPKASSKTKSERPRFLLNLFVPVSAAALVILGIFVAFNVGSTKVIPGDPSQIIAKVDTVYGEVRHTSLVEGEQAYGTLALDDLLYAGQVIVTGENSGLGLQLGQLKSLRVDENTELEVLNASHLLLKQGAIYFDSGRTGSASQLTVYTTYGEFKDIGTQFELRVNRDNAIVRVREGEVEAKEKGLFGQRIRIQELKQASFIPSQQPQISSVQADDESWQWTSQLAREFKLQDSSLDDFLRWLSRENGWQLKYANDRLGLKASTIRLNGSIQGMFGEDALRIVCETTTVVCHLVNANIVVTER